MKQLAINVQIHIKSNDNMLFFLIIVQLEENEKPSALPSFGG